MALPCLSAAHLDEQLAPGEAQLDEVFAPEGKGAPKGKGIRLYWQRVWVQGYKGKRVRVMIFQRVQGYNGRRVRILQRVKVEEYKSNVYSKSTGIRV